jgi:hypothetical protein
MILNRSFTKVHQTARKPLTDKPFLRILGEVAALAEAVEDVVVEDVRFALTGERNTEAPADSGSKEKRK